MLREVESLQAATRQHDGTTCPECETPISSGARCASCGAVVSAGRYRIERVLARTLHSRVYVAVDEAGRRVALKELVFARVPSAQELESFEREGRLLQQLDHPSIPKFLDGFREGSGPGLRLYLATSLVEGETLEQRLTRGALSTDEALSLTRALLDVLVCLHGRTPPIFHRDIKPANVVFTPEGRPVVIDFDTARNVAGQTHGATLVGTFGYMAPEQLGGTVDVTSDVYGVAATVLHALTGRTPMELLDRSGLSLQVPENIEGRLRGWLRRALQPSRSARFSSASLARSALEKPQSMEPVARSRSTLLVAGAVATTLAIVTTIVASQPRAMVAQPPSAGVSAGASTQALVPLALAEVPEHLRPTTEPISVYSAKVTAASEQEVFLWVDLENATAGQLTACAQVLSDEPNASFGCSPVLVPRGRGFYTLRVAPSSDAPMQSSSRGIGVDVWAADGKHLQYAFFAFPHAWRKP